MVRWFGWLVGWMKTGASFIGAGVTNGKFMVIKIILTPNYFYKNFFSDKCKCKRSCILTRNKNIQMKQTVIKRNNRSKKQLTLTTRNIKEGCYYYHR